VVAAYIEGAFGSIYAAILNQWQLLDEILNPLLMLAEDLVERLSVP